MFWLGSAYYVTLPDLYSVFLSLHNCTASLFLLSHSIKQPPQTLHLPACSKSSVKFYISCHIYRIEIQHIVTILVTFIKIFMVFIKYFDYRIVAFSSMVIMC